LEESGQSVEVGGVPLSLVTTVSKKRGSPRRVGKKARDYNSRCGRHGDGGGGETRDLKIVKSKVKLALWGRGGRPIWISRRDGQG